MVSNSLCGQYVIVNMVGMWSEKRSVCGLYSMWSVNRSVCGQHVVGYMISGIWLACVGSTYVVGMWFVQYVVSK